MLADKPLFIETSAFYDRNDEKLGNLKEVELKKVTTVTQGALKSDWV